MDCNIVKVTQKVCDLLKLNQKYIGYYIILKKGNYINELLPIDEIQKVQISSFEETKIIQSFVMLKRDKIFELQLYKQPMEYITCEGK